MKKQKNATTQQKTTQSHSQNAATQNTTVNFFGAGTCKEDFLW